MFDKIKGLQNLKSISKKLDTRQKIVILLVIIILLVSLVYLGFQSRVNGHSIIVSGTIETTEIHLGSEFGGRVESVLVDEGSGIQTGQLLVAVHRSSGTSEKVRSPIDGVVLERTIEPGEIASPGSTLLVLADLEKLTLTVYVPEDRYGQVTLGQTCQVQVDSFPQQLFFATVSHIADEAEFTPRNVQTTDSRKSTVFAIDLSLTSYDGRLKPGMPADVTCSVSGE